MRFRDVGFWLAFDTSTTTESPRARRRARHARHRSRVRVVLDDGDDGDVNARGVRVRASRVRVRGVARRRHAPARRVPRVARISRARRRRVAAESAAAPGDRANPRVRLHGRREHVRALHARGRAPRRLPHPASDAPGQRQAARLPRLRGVVAKAERRHRRARRLLPRDQRERPPRRALPQRQSHGRVRARARQGGGLHRRGDRPRDRLHAQRVGGD